MTELKILETAPKFIAPATNGKQIDISNYIGNQVVLFFYPFDNSYMCTKEAEHFRDYYPAFNVINTHILGISLGGIAKKEKFCFNSNLPFNLISDKDKQISITYGCLNSIKFWKFNFDYINRSTFLIDNKGQIAKIWRSVKINGHAKEVFETAQKLHTQGKL